MAELFRLTGGDRRQPGCLSMAFCESAYARSIFFRVFSDSSSDAMALRTSRCNSPRILLIWASQTTCTLLLFFGGIFFYLRASAVKPPRAALRRRGEDARTWKMTAEKVFKLLHGDVGGFAEVTAALQAFLEDFRGAAAEQVALNIDVSEMPLYADFHELQELGAILCDFEDCFRRVSCLRILAAPGLQEQLIRGILLLLPFPVPVEVVAAGAAHEALSGTRASI